MASYLFYEFHPLVIALVLLFDSHIKTTQCIILCEADLINCDIYFFLWASLARARVWLLSNGLLHRE